MTRLQERLPLISYRRPLLGTGLCGGLSAFSTMQVELLKMIDAGGYLFGGGVRGRECRRGLPCDSHRHRHGASGLAAAMNPVWWARVVLIGGYGAVLRFVAEGAVGAALGMNFPLGTLVLIVSGAVVLGLITGLALGGAEALLAGTAAVGSYTTILHVDAGTQRFTQERENRSAATNVAASLIPGVAAAALGGLMGANW